jgi:cytochrome oxidase Cu insertion factor (SCO1/SenC/PrrC family)
MAGPCPSRGLRGRTLLLTFFDSRCVDRCPLAGRQLAEILGRMPEAERPVLLVVSVNPRGDTPECIPSAMAHWNLNGPWRWYWLRGSEHELEDVWAACGITVDARSRAVVHGLTLYLIDRQGFQRSGYLFPFLPNLVQLDLETLARARL